MVLKRMYMQEGCLHERPQKGGAAQDGKACPHVSLTLPSIDRTLDLAAPRLSEMLKAIALHRIIPSPALAVRAVRKHRERQMRERAFLAWSFFLVSRAGLEPATL